MAYLHHEISRSFHHKTYGEIGKVVLSPPAGKWTLDGNDLPDTSVSHLVKFALQTLQDAYAGAKSTDEATGAFNKKYDALLNGTIGERGSGDGASEFVRVARSVTRLLLKSKMGVKSPEWAAFIGLDDDEQNARLDVLYEKNEAALKGAVEREIELRRERAANKAAISVDFSL